MSATTHSFFVRFRRSGDFYRALKHEVDQYFEQTGVSKRDNVSLYIKALIFLVWFAGSYYGLVFVATNWWQATLCAISLGLAAAGIGFNVQHDGGHGAFSNRLWINRLAAMSLDLLGASSFMWHCKHVNMHHLFVNVDPEDDDINVGYFGRLAPTQRWRRFHRVQHWYLWFLYGLLPVKWQGLDDYVSYARGRIGETPFKRPKGKDLAVFVGGKLVFMTYAFGIPMCFHPWWHVLIMYAVATWCMGVVIAHVFQLAHIVEGVKFPLPDAAGQLERDWAEHQVVTTANFSPRSRLADWYFGGLNRQVEHHLFPKIAHVHYSKLSKLVKKTCHQYGLPYNVHPTLWSALASHFRWLKKMGQPV